MWFLSKFVDQKNKKAWEAQGSINNNLFSAIDVCTKHIDKRTDMYFDEIRELNMRIAVLEEGLNAKPVITGKLTLSSMSTTDAIIRCLKEKGNKLHYSRIYDMIQYYNLTNPNVKLQSVKSILYQLARQNRISLCNGTKTGMFFI